MDDLKRMAIFATVVRHGSMSGAARALGMSPSAISQQVRQLEQAGGVTLLHRSTRKLTLTEAGARYHAQCAAMCAAANQARAELAASRDVPSGELRLAAPVGFARHISPALGPLLAAHPSLRLHLLVDDALIDLIEARVDLAVRFGGLPDSSWAARSLGTLHWWLCAAPQWLARHGTPQTPGQLLPSPGWASRAKAAWASRCKAARPVPSRTRCACSHASPATTSSRSSRCAKPAWAWPCWAASTCRTRWRAASWCA